jgi:hypothetical protein
VITVGKDTVGNIYGIEVSAITVSPAPALNPQMTTDLERVVVGSRTRLHFRWHRMGSDGPTGGEHWETVFADLDGWELVFDRDKLRRICEFWSDYQLNDSMICTEAQAEAVAMILDRWPGASREFIEGQLDRHGLLVDREYRWLRGFLWLDGQLPPGGAERIDYLIREVSDEEVYELIALVEGVD